MERYLINTETGHRIIYGDYFKAISLAKKGTKVKTIPQGINDDDIIYKRIKFEEL